MSPHRAQGRKVQGWEAIVKLGLVQERPSITVIKSDPAPDERTRACGTAASVGFVCRQSSSTMPTSLCCSHEGTDCHTPIEIMALALKPTLMS